jgi:hypothetical protein
MKGIFFKGFLISIVFVVSIVSCSKQETEYPLSLKSTNDVSFDDFKIGARHNEVCLQIISEINKFKNFSHTLSIEQFDSIVLKSDTIYNQKLLDEIKVMISQHHEIKLKFENSLTEIYLSVFSKDGVICPATTNYFIKIDQVLNNYDRNGDVLGVISDLSLIREAVIYDKTISIVNGQWLFSIIDLAMHSIVFWETDSGLKYQNIAGAYWADIAHWVQCSGDGMQNGYSYNYIKDNCVMGAAYASACYFFYGVSNTPVWL